MPYITREDGERFVIPSYRDVLTSKQKSQLKKDILLLSQSYGEYITMQKKGPDQYEVAFSSDTGYLLGESIWQHFNRPVEMIYCEAIPNTTEAILVIVKGGAVYLDGSFPVDSIPEELIIFLTQQNDFEIYIYGDVPISQAPEGGKFSFEASSVKSFSVLEKPIFPTLTLLKIYQLQLVDQVLKAHGIGEVPYKPIVGGVVLLLLVWLGWTYLSEPSVEIPLVTPTAPAAPEANPYQAFYDALQTPAPDVEVNAFINELPIFFSITGWYPDKIVYAQGTISAQIRSTGGSIAVLNDWAHNNDVIVSIGKTGFSISKTISVEKRAKPQQIFPLKKTVEIFIDKMAQVYPGNNLKLGDFVNKGSFTEVNIAISFQSVTPPLLSLIGEQFKDMPFTLLSLSLDTIENGNLTGTFNLNALGS